PPAHFNSSDSLQHDSSPFRSVPAGPPMRGDGLGACRDPLRLLGSPGRTLFAFRLPGSTEPEALHDEAVVVVPLPVLVGPVVGAHLGVDDELVSLARGARDRLAEWTERGEPDAGGDLPRPTLLVLAGIVVAYQAELRVGTLAFDGELRVAGKIADGGERKAVHASLLVLVASADGTVISLEMRAGIGIAFACVFAQKCMSLESPAPAAARYPRVGNELRRGDSHAADR